MTTWYVPEEVLQMNWEKRDFSNKCPFNNWLATLKKIKLDTYLIPCMKIKSQQTKYLKVKKKKTKL